jgi:hypothetical protein
MAAAKKSASLSREKGSEIDAFIDKLDHPMKAELQVVRALILGADASIAEGIKWNAPSFRTSEYFATTNLRSMDAVQIIMHFGAKVNAISASGVVIEDPDGLLKWLAKDRATIKFHDMKSIKANSKAFAEIVRQWIVHVG